MLKLPMKRLQDELSALRDWWATLGVWKCKLFTNAVVVGSGSVLASFVEAAWAGYAPQDVPGWSGPTWSAPDAVFTAAGPITFNNTSPNPVVFYGYYLIDGTGNYLWAESDPQAPVTLTAGQAYVLTLRRTHRNQGD